MSKQQRMSPKDRKESILKAAIPLFAKQGYKGTTTKMISQAAGISEALLFRYFKNKKELFIELKNQVYPNVDIAVNTVAKLTPSTSGLIILIYLMIFETLGPAYNREEFDVFNRLLTFNLLEDGELAKAFYESKFEKWLPYMVKHFKAAEKFGDLKGDNIRPENKLRFVHHLTVGFIHVNYQDIVDYKLNQNELVTQVTLFALRGIGLTENAIQTHFNPELFYQLFSAQDLKSIYDKALI